MSFLKIVLPGLFLILIAGLAYVAITDVEIPQEEVTKTLPASNFIK